MIQPQALITLFGYNADLILRQTRAMSHAQSLWQPHAQCTSVNWLLGHIISSRMRALLLVGEPVLWDDARRLPYRSGASPITVTSQVALPLAELIHDFEQTQQRLLTALGRMTYAELCEPSGYQTNTVGVSVAYVHFHETHHLGQILYLAPLIGVPAVWLTQ